MRQALALFIALCCFALIAVAFGAASVLAPGAQYVMIGAAVLGILYVATGGRAWFGTRERPERVLGRKVRFRELDGFGAPSPEWPLAELRTFSDGQYRAVFLEPLVVKGREERSVTLSARHVGYPISRVRRFGMLAVNGELESGEGFIAFVNLV